MIQRQKETAIGLQLSEEGAQITLFQPGMKEPVTVDAQGAPADEQYLISVDPKVWRSAAGLGGPIEDLVTFFREVLSDYVSGVEPSHLRIMICVPSLTKLLSSRIPQALQMLGVERRNIYMQDYLSGFYYYTINQRADLWNGDVALVTSEDDTLIGYVMHIDYSRSPALVTIVKAGRQDVGQRARDGRDDESWNREKDRLFFEFLKRVFERRSVVTCYLVGNFFSRDWAVRSYQYLCTRRHAFQGQNLFSKGACYAAMERAGLLRPQNLLFMGEDMVSENLGMYMRVRGRTMYYPLVTAGVNWYEAYHECEFIPDGETGVTIVTRPMDSDQETQHILRLRDMPRRPNRATRLKMTLYYTAPGECVVEVEDRGFGGFFPPSGKKWKRRIYL